MQKQRYNICIMIHTAVNFLKRILNHVLQITTITATIKTLSNGDCKIQSL